MLVGDIATDANGVRLRDNGGPLRELDEIVSRYVEFDGVDRDPSISAPTDCSNPVAFLKAPVVLGTHRQVADLHITYLSPFKALSQSVPLIQADALLIRLKDPVGAKR